ncbi:MAG: hypothetical protein CMM87_03185 [Rickettsiales bacterium]|nr:hypothetical protein [Rickettsiales bacterium]|tara:strand:+ start:3396 stop:4598 length:1203 start_codon:yes stop_codon:yes gene_type:complete
MKTLLLYSNYTDQMSYYDDWIDAFKEHPVFDLTAVNLFNNSFPNIHKDVIKLIERAELIILHHSMNGDTLKYLTPLVSALKNRRGKLISFVGNEVNLPTIGMKPKINILKEIKADFIATQLLLDAGEWLYKECSESRVVSIPHALNPMKFKKTTSIKDRKIDIGTRSARYGVYIGDTNRNNIIQFFHKNSFGLKVDLGVNCNDQKRFDRNGWVNFLNSCKSTLSTEAGSFYLDPDDKIVIEIHKYLKRKSSKFVLPNETFLRKGYQYIVPSFIRKIVISLLKDQIVEVDGVDQDTNFQEIYDKFFANAKKAPVYTKAISSRHFDAIGTHTLHVMYPGRYNDILKPHEHYFELQKDHSNTEDLLSLLKNSKKLEVITSETYDYVLQNHTHKHRLDKLLESL